MTWSTGAVATDSLYIYCVVGATGDVKNTVETRGLAGDISMATPG